MASRSFRPPTHAGVDRRDAEHSDSQEAAAACVRQSAPPVVRRDHIEREPALQVRERLPLRATPVPEGEQRRNPAPNFRIRLS